MTTPFYDASGVRVRVPVGVCPGIGGNATVACDDGTVWYWGIDQEKIDAMPLRERESFMSQIKAGRALPPYTWVQYHAAVPGTFAALHPDPGPARVVPFRS